MKPFVPAFDALWKGSKASLHNSTRAIFLRLCQEVRDAERDGAFVLPHARDDAAAVGMVCPGPRAEMELALKELTDPGDPMIAFEDADGRRVLLVLSWDGWALMGRSPASRASTDSARSKSAERARRWRENRKRSPNTSERSPNGSERSLANDSERVREQPPNAFANGSAERDANSSERSHGGGKGGATPPDQNRSDGNVEEKREVVVERERARDADAADLTPPGMTPKPVPTRPGQAPGLVATLRSHPELAEYEPGGMLKLEEVARNLRGVADNYVMGGKVREDEVRERVEWAISEVAREVRSANQTASPLAGGKVAKKLEMFAKTNLGKSREQWEADRGLREGRPSPRPGAAPLPPPARKPNPQGLADMIAAKRAE